MQEKKFSCYKTNLKDWNLKIRRKRIDLKFNKANNGNNNGNDNHNNDENRN